MDVSPTPDDVSELYDSKHDEMAELDSQDRLSELPYSLIHLILSFLPMREVIRTTLISKRWRDLWITIPCLNFEDDTKKLAKFQNFVNRALILWRGTKILKFEVVFFYEQHAYNDLDVWLRLAVENGVEELYISLRNDEDALTYIDTEYWPPQGLYSCSSIRKLTLLAGNLKPNGNVCWNQLKFLRIDGVCLCERDVDQVLRGSPQLEILILRIIEKYENLNIKSSSLKELMIERFLDTDEDEDTVLTIWAPNLEMLIITGDLYTKYLLMNVSSLTDATLLVSGANYYDFSGYEKYGEMLMQVYQSIHHVENVTLSDCCIQVLGAMKKKDKLSPPSDAKFLKLYCSEIVEIIDLLEMFPKLTVLVLKLSDLWIDEKESIFKPFVLKFDEEKPLKYKTDIHKSCLMHLRTVKITWVACDPLIYILIEFVLKYATTLEKMIFRPMVITSIGLGRESLFFAAKKLLSMPRSSPTAKVILRDYRS